MNQQLGVYFFIQFGSGIVCTVRYDPKEIEVVRLTDINALRIKLKEARKLSPAEKLWANKMLSVDFPGRDILKKQVEHCQVVSYCGCGCGTVDLEVQSNIPRFPYDIRIPVGMIKSDVDVPILFNLHVVNGVLNEIEVYRADSEPLSDHKINIDNCEITIHA